MSDTHQTASLLVSERNRIETNRILGICYGTNPVCYSTNPFRPMRMICIKPLPCLYLKRTNVKQTAFSIHVMGQIQAVILQIQSVILQIRSVKFTNPVCLLIRTVILQIQAVSLQIQAVSLQIQAVSLQTQTNPMRFASICFAFPCGLKEL